MDEILLNGTKKVSAGNHEATEFWENDYDENDLYQVENISLNETKEKLEWRKHAFEYEILYVIENRNKMIYIHDKKVNTIAECNLIHDIINPLKRTKQLNSHYSPILHWRMNTRKDGENFKNFRILLDSGCSSKIVMKRLVETLYPEKDDVM